MTNKSDQSCLAVAADKNGQPMIFAPDDQGLLCLIVKGKQNQNEIIELNQKFAFSAQQTIRTLAVSQNTDGTIHLVFVIKEDGKADQLFVLRPMTAQPDDWKALSGRDGFYTGPQWDITIREILLVSNGGISHINIDGSNNSRDLATMALETPKHIPRFTLCSMSAN